MYSGSVPIDLGDDSRSLFFVFQPKLGDPVDEVTIWLNGGPGCSSLEAFFQENGRFVWQPGTFAPVENPYSWVNLTNILWYDCSTALNICWHTLIKQKGRSTCRDWFLPRYPHRYHPGRNRSGLC